MLDSPPADTKEFSFEQVNSRRRALPRTQNWEQIAASAILILGSARSGTTWLAKIIDSHPDILYRHEPDELTCDTVWVSPAAQIATWISQRGLRSAAKRPYFAKSWRPVPLEFTRKGLAVALAAAQRIGVTSKLTATVGLPDLIAPRRLGQVRAAVKLVNWDGSGVVATMPDTRCCFILRHPCGQISSILAGWADGQFPTRQTGSGAPVDLAVAASFAGSRGINGAAFGALSNAGKLAWSWLAFNEPMIEALRSLPNARIVIYEDLCRRPEAVSRDLFSFAGLEWQPQTAAFLANSTRADRSNSFYDVFRITAAAAERWRQTMSRQDQHVVRSIVRGSPLVHYWPDLAAEQS
jgi:hypothetical protein